MAKSTFSQWNASADWYDRRMRESGDKLNREIIRPVLLKILGSLRGKTILDVGCGSGYLAFELAQTAKRVVGTDFAPNFVKLCQKKYNKQSNLSFQIQDVSKKFEFQNNSFNIIFCKMVLQYVKNINNFVCESTRLLKKNGKVVIVVDHPFHTQFYYAQSLAGKKNRKYKSLENYFSKNSQTKISLWNIELTWYPKTISDYIKPFMKTGLLFSHIEEIGETKDGITVPRILLLSFTKS